MSEQSRIIRKFERMMGHSHDELMEIGRQKRQQISSNPGKVIGHFEYDFDKKTEKFIPAKDYKKATENNYKNNLSSQ